MNKLYQKKLPKSIMGIDKITKVSYDITIVNKGGIFMKEIKNINFTDDPLKNIYIMIPLLDDEARKTISHLMYGYYLGKESGNKKKKEMQEV